MTRWLFSTNAKIFTILFLIFSILCLLFAIFSGILDFAFSVLIINFDFFSPAKLVLTCATGVPIKPGEETISSTEKDSSQKPLKLSNEQKEAFSVSPELADILIGLCLGDLCVEKLKTSINARLRFLQSINHTDYLKYLWDKFQNYCRQEPQIINR